MHCVVHWRNIVAHETWLVTGAAGFIGTHMVRRLLNDGHRVIGVDNFSTGLRENIEPFKDNPSWQLIVLDICDIDIESIFEEYRPTHVLHLAAIVSVQYCEAHQDRAYAVNADAFRQLLRYAHRYEVQHLIYASSSAVYGMSQPGPIPESASLAPISVYGDTKVCNEEDARAIHLVTGLQCTGLRFFNLFGPHQSATNGYAAVIPLWAAAISRGERPIIYGDGSATRDYCHIDNVVNAVVKLAKASLKGAQVYNVGTGIATTLNDLYATLCDVLKQYPDPQYELWRPADIEHSLADITAIKAACGYEPQVSLREGLKRLCGEKVHVE
jgi:nucleoside-diphosphate-sugar epimerase